MVQKKAIRILSLVLAVVCLFGAAALVVLGLPAQAEAGGTLTLVGLYTGNTPLAHLNSSAGENAGQVTFKFSPNGSVPAQSDLEKAVLTTNFFADTNSFTGTALRVSEDKKVFTVSGKYQPVDTLTAVLTVGSASFSYTAPLGEFTALPGEVAVNMDYSITSNGTVVDRMTIQQRVDLTVTVEDSGMSLAAYRLAKQTATVSLGNTSFSNVQAVLSNGATMDGGGVRYTLTFDDIRYTGKSSDLSVGVRYGSGLPWRRMTVWMPEAVVDESALSSSSTPPMPDPDDYDGNSSTSSYVFTPPPTPNIIVSEYDYGGGMVMAAKDVTLGFSFQNTSDRVTIENIVMKVTMPEAFAIKNSSNTFYFAKLPPRDKESAQLVFSVKPSAEPISHPIKLAFTYETVINKERKSHTADVEIAVPVSQLNRVTLQPVTVSESFIMGQEENAFDAKFVNMGKSQIYNTTLTMVGENLKNSGFSVFLGNIDSGKEATGSFTIEAAAAGDISGEVVLSYEDASMNITELRTPFFTVANEPPQMEPPMDFPEEMPADMPMEAPKWYQKYPPYYYVVGGVVLLIVLAYAVKLWKSVREKKLAKMDEDF